MRGQMAGAVEVEAGALAALASLPVAVAVAVRWLPRERVGQAGRPRSPLASVRASLRREQPSPSSASTAQWQRASPWAPVPQALRRHHCTRGAAPQRAARSRAVGVRYASSLPTSIKLLTFATPRQF